MALRARSRSPSKALPDGEYTIQQKCNMRFLDAHKDGTKIYDVCTGTDSQIWVIKGTGGGGYTIQQKIDMRFLDAFEDEKNDYRTCTRPAQGNDSQIWMMKDTGPGEYTIQQKVNMRFLDAYTDAKEDYKSCTRAAQGDDSQKWVIKKAAPKATLTWSGVYTDSNAAQVVTMTQLGSTVTAHASKSFGPAPNPSSGTVDGKTISMFDLKGTLADGVITWSNGSKWIGPVTWSGVYKDSKDFQTIKITQSGSEVQLHGSKHFGSAPNPSTGKVEGNTISAWDLKGTLADGVISWSNGSKWTIATTSCRFNFTFKEGAKPEDIMAKLKKVSGVENTELMESLGIGFVDVKVGVLDLALCEKALQEVDGVATIEKDAVVTAA